MEFSRLPQLTCQFFGQLTGSSQPQHNQANVDISAKLYGERSLEQRQDVPR